MNNNVLCGSAQIINNHLQNQLRLLVYNYFQPSNVSRICLEGMYKLIIYIDKLSYVPPLQLFQGVEVGTRKG